VIEILAFAIVDNERRYQRNGDAVLARFDCEVEGIELDRVELVRTGCGLVIRPPRRGTLQPAAKAALANLALAAFITAGGVEDLPLGAVA
jgi:hypothetical protein